MKITYCLSSVKGLLFILFLMAFPSCQGRGPCACSPIPPDEPVEIEESPRISDDALLELVQKSTFGYFWDFAEPTSGMARERSQDDAYGGESPRIITIGGSGFGISSFPAAVERGWITRAQAIERLKKILDFLEKADKYHGAFSHWYIGTTAKTRAFSQYDNGGDIVETAFLAQGLLINYEYFSTDTADEKDIRARIDAIWRGIDWGFYTNGKKSITWHWSPNYNFQINMPVQGWNEALIVYVLAAASPTNTIDKATYDQGWAKSGNIRNGSRYYGQVLPLGESMGGPLFFAHYSFIGLDPNGLQDQYANYFEQNKAHALINYEYCKDNPKNFKGYGENSWGLTASDNKDGYSAHSPSNDLGTISPTAALSSFPYTPKESKQALEYFYYKQNKKLWGKYGFCDAFSEQYNWYSNGYIAIDQGPIIAMIENYRTKQLWNLFMKNKDVQNGLKKLGFSSPHLTN